MVGKPPFQLPTQWQPGCSNSRSKIPRWILQPVQFTLPIEFFTASYSPIGPALGLNCISFEHSHFRCIKIQLFLIHFLSFSHTQTKTYSKIQSLPLERGHLLLKSQPLESLIWPPWNSYHLFKKQTSLVLLLYIKSNLMHKAEAEILTPS